LAFITQFFPDYASALAACGPGYLDSDVAEVIAYKAALPIDVRNLLPEQALNTITAIGLAAAAISERPLGVLDFGGGCGFHYFSAAACMGAPFRWAIVETASMAERASKLAQGRFEVFTEIEAAAKALPRIDLVHASSAIQYVAKPLATLEALAALKAPYFCLARFPVWTGAERIGLQETTLAQNGLGPMPPYIADRLVRYPVTFIDFGEMLRALDNYRLMLVMASPSAVYQIEDAGNKQVLPGITAIMRLRASG